MALPNQPWTTSYPGAQDTVGSEQPDLTPDTTPGAGDGHRVLVSHMHSLRDKLQAVATKLGDGANLPAGSVGAKVAALESAPPAHATSHENGGGDEISIAGLSGVAADPQTPASHATSHENGGADEISVAGLSGALADPQTPTSHAASHDAGGADAMAIDAAAGTGSLRTLGTTATSACAGNDARLSDARTPTAHATSHENGGADEISVAGLSGALADPQTPTSHAASHQNGGADEIDVGGLSGVLADDQNADALRETGGPTLLTMGAVADGEYLTRSGTTIVGAAGGGGGGIAPPVGSAVKYFIDGTAGSDVTGDGLAWGTAFATFDHVWNNVIPVAVRDRYLVEFRNTGALSDANTNGGYHGDKLFMGPSAGIAIMGETFGLTAGAASTTVSGNDYYIADATGGFAPGAEVGKWIRMTSGPASGDVRMVVRNDSFGFYVNQAFSATPTAFGGDGWEYVTPTTPSNIEGDFAISVQAEGGGYGVKFDMIGHVPGVAGDRIRVYGVDADFRTAYQINGVRCEADATKTFNVKNVPLNPATGDDDGVSTLVFGTGFGLTNGGDLYVSGYTIEDMVAFAAKHLSLVNCKVTGEIGGTGKVSAVGGTGGTEVELVLIADTNFHGGILSNFMADGGGSAAGSDAIRIQRSRVKWVPANTFAQSGVVGFLRHGVHLVNSQLLVDSSTNGLYGNGGGTSVFGMYARWGSQVRLTSTVLNAPNGVTGQAGVYSGTATWTAIQGGTALVDPVEFCVFSVDDMWADSWG